MDIRLLDEKLSTLGIGEGDKVYVASDISLLLYEEKVCSRSECDFFLNQLVDLLQLLVGKEGTLLFPMFTWSFCRGVPFDYNQTRGETGVLSNWVWNKRSEFHRTMHPMYSFMVWGRDAEYLTSLKNTDAWGQDSPFAYLHQRQAKQLLVNVSTLRGLAFMHYVEQCMNVPYRLFKAFSGVYKDKNGEETYRTYSMYVRNLALNMENEMPEDFLDIYGAAQVMMVGSVRLKLIDLAKAYCTIAQDICSNDARNVVRYKG